MTPLVVNGDERTMDDAALIRAFLRTVTDFGSPWALLPASLGVFVSLWLMDERRGALAFLSGAGVCALAVVLSKIGVMTLGGLGPLYSPSGHTAIAAFFYASFGFLAISLTRATLAKVFAAALIPLILLVAVSRFVIGGHNPAEALLGLVIGAVSFETFRRQSALRVRPPGVIARAAPVGLVVTFLCARLAGFVSFDEESIMWFAHWLRGQVF